MSQGVWYGRCANQGVSKDGGYACKHRQEILTLELSANENERSNNLGREVGLSPAAKNTSGQIPT